MAYTQHSWMLMDIVVGLSVRPSVRLFVYACPTIWGLFFFAFFIYFFSKVRVGAKEGGSHYWEMSVAITCGYGGYLLPLLAAHSSCHLEPHGNKLQWNINKIIKHHLKKSILRKITVKSICNIISDSWCLSFSLNITSILVLMPLNFL